MAARLIRVFRMLYARWVNWIIRINHTPAGRLPHRSAPADVYPGLRGVSQSMIKCRCAWCGHRAKVWQYQRAGCRGDEHNKSMYLYYYEMLYSLLIGIALDSRWCSVWPWLSNLFRCRCASRMGSIILLGEVLSSGPQSNVRVSFHPICMSFCIRTTSLKSIFSNLFGRPLRSEYSFQYRQRWMHIINPGIKNGIYNKADDGILNLIFIVC